MIVEMSPDTSENHLPESIAWHISDNQKLDEGAHYLLAAGKTCQ